MEQAYSRGCGRTVHIARGGGGADVGGGDREQGEEADDGGDQQADVDRLRSEISELYCNSGTRIHGKDRN
ncbi:unnamed protein product [Linum trigynum]|uniref:Uncharacterized protein n=1 Tax=Linum trigynum TaxID=586398 RepID=A0AAV2GVU3_9ROSI